MSLIQQLKDKYNSVDNKEVQCFGMEAFIQKASDSKGKLLLGVGGVALVGLFGYLYKQYKNDNPQNIQLHQIPVIQQQQFKLEKELDKFKAKINLINPTFEQVKKMIAFSSQMTFKEIERVHKDFRKSRRQVKSQGDLKAYFKTCGVGMIRIKQIASTLQQAIMQDIGLTPEMIIPNKEQIVQFMNQQHMQRAYGNKQVTLSDVRNAIKIQVDFMKEDGDRLVQTVIQNCRDWQSEAKKFIPDVFTLYLSDEIALKHPEMDRYDMRGAEKRFEKYLVAETNQMKYEMVPKITRLIQELGIFAEQSQSYEQQPSN